MSFDKTILHYSLWINQEEFFLKLGFLELNQVQGEIIEQLKEANF